jgi:hypothetical protein
MMELFAESPKTTKQVAELLGQPPTRLYHHVSALERAGLLVLRETRQNRGAVEKWYASVAGHIGTSGVRQKGRKARAARRAVAATVLEQARQEVLAIPAGAREAALLTRLVLVVTPTEIPRVRKWLFETLQRMRTELELDDDSSAGADSACERWAVTLAFAPASGPARRRRPAVHK